MAKATHSGTCQICGGFQKLPNGVLSQHGYTVQWGWFNGICSGSKNLPFEQSIALIEEQIVFVKRKIERTREAVQELINDKGTKAWVHHYIKGILYSTGRYVWSYAQLETHKRNPESEYTAYNYFTYEDKKKEIAGSFHTCNSLEDVARLCNTKYISYKLTKDIASMEDYITWQEERTANWKPSELTPVEEK